MRSRWAMCAALLCGCSLTFDGTMPDVPLPTGTPDEATWSKLNQAPADDFYLVLGADGDYWLVIDETPTLRMTRLAMPPATDQITTNPNLEVTALWEAFFLLQVDPQAVSPTVLTIRAAGQTTPPQQYTFAPGPGLLIPSGPDGGTFLYWVLSSTTTMYQILHRDGTSGRTLPVPAGLDPTDPLALGWLQFSGSAAWLFSQDANGNVVAHSTTAQKDVPLGMRPQHLRLDDLNQALIYCDSQGFHSVAYDGSFDVVLDPNPCNFGVTDQEGEEFLYVSGDGLRRVALDGSSPPQVVLPSTVQQILNYDPKWGYMYALDPSGLYVSGASDGWLQGRMFMQRGREATFSSDDTRLRWLEHAATLVGSGDLMSGAVEDALAGTSTLLLAHNVEDFDELSSGVVLAEANYAFEGPQNQVILIDEVQRTAQVVANNADSYSFLPTSSTDLLVTRLTGPGTFDLYQVPLPSP